MAKAMQQGSSNMRTYEKAGGMAEEVLYNIRTVASFVNFDFEMEKYQVYLVNSLAAGIKSGYKSGFGIGFIIFIIYSSYALSVGYGSVLVSDGTQINQNTKNPFGAGDVITVLFSVIFGCFSLGQATPNLKAMIEAKSAAKELFDLRDKLIVSNASMGTERPPKEDLIGNLVLDNVLFAYPSKPDIKILKHITINFRAGEKTAIVGESGSGKSTILSLVERFYEPQFGDLVFDNLNIKNIDIKYWRSLIGYVPQEPVLFNTTIRDNIVFGRQGITDNDIEEVSSNI
jgi:ATP-binding cassette subfamily B (MDR/TAP) protein 1